MLRRTQVQTNDIGGVSLEVWIIQGHIAIQPVGLEAVLGATEKPRQPLLPEPFAPAVNERVAAGQFPANLCPRVTPIEQQNQARTARIIRPPGLTFRSLTELHVFFL
jgi:hypothetical protein